ncbi:MAG TPA: NAD-dependent succinate-semialdehyde dehydrogenase [Armatimonadetes bacterium]|nr:NAD-dependent succinate-semialdehyde dehydrogenase [Armatimonadota bacterium]
MLIDGKWVESSSGMRVGIINPATEEVIIEVPYGSREDARHAIDAAYKAFQTWSQTTPYERHDILIRVAQLIHERLDDIARVLTMEVGKPLSESQGELKATAGIFEWFAEEGKRIYGEVIPPSVPTKRHIVIRQPVGVCVAIVPWNFPVALMARKVAPALAAGCTAIVRPATQAPLAIMELMKCLVDAGIPAGVVQLITGPADELTDELLCDMRVRKIGFTGSTEVGRQLMAKAAAQIKRISLELGGQAPVLVFPDVDVDKAAQLTVRAKFRNMGQVCISPNRIYVHEDIADAFIEKCVQYASALRIGNGLEPDTDVGPLFDRATLEKVERHLQDALAKGAKILCGGKRPSGEQFERGFWFEPTVLRDVKHDMLLTCEETFGPLLPIVTFNDTDAVIEQANSTPYGLASFLLTNDMRTAIYVAERLETGIVGIWDFTPAAAQCPFGGVKQSGLGRECGWEGIHEYLETKYISINLE